MRVRYHKALMQFTLIALLVVTPPVQAQDGEHLIDMDIEELMQVQITSVSKKEESAFQAAAAVFVITAEDIRRSSATSIPELLRMVPGLHVARLSSSQWAISSRGFNGRFSNKLLVLIDGRTVYNPAFAGVDWDVQDTLLEDIERIEVIRGPGAMLWGLNAVNGIINVITKNAAKTRGGLVVSGGGTEERGFSSVRYGEKLSDQTDMRVFTKYFKRDDLESAGGLSTGDEWDTVRSGFRIDHDNDADDLTLEGELYHNNGDASGSLPLIQSSSSGSFVDSSVEDVDAGGGFILGKWDHTISATSKTTTQFYYDNVKRDDSAGAKQRRDTFDLDFQHQSALVENLELIWGAGYRHVVDQLDVEDTGVALFTPETEYLDVATAFVQSELSLFDDSVKVITGSKFSHNDFTGFEVQPGARLSWEINEQNQVWSSFTRSLRVPARYEEDGRILFSSLPLPNGVPGFVELQPRRLPDTEELFAYEVGYRYMPTSDLSFDVAAFYNQYDNLLSGVAGGPPSLDTRYGFPAVVQPAVASSGSTADLYGGELVANWTPWSWWRLQSTFSHTIQDYDIEETSYFGSAPISASTAFENTPENMATLRSLVSLPADVEFDTMLRFVDNFGPRGFNTTIVGSYTQLDVRLGWHPVKSLELALIGQNLLESEHREFIDRTSFNQRGVYAKASLSF